MRSCDLGWFSKALPMAARVLTALTLWLMTGGLVPAHASSMDKSGPAVVGQVSFLIGSVRAKSATGAEEELTKGASIRVGDQLMTQAGGHVHILFVDGARISLRPLSRLTIEDYAQGSGKKGEAAIRFRLDEGVVRSITGSWGETARERFRLNTPLAAIGIKGTDFVVKAEPNRTLASVVTGAIVLAPMDPLCRGTLGACDNGRALVLSEAMRGQMLELQKGQLNPVLIPAFDLMSRRDGGVGKTSLLRSDKDLNSSSETASTDPEGAAGDPSSQNVTLGASAVTTATNLLSNKDALIWARYPWVARMTGDEFVQTFEAANRAGLQSIIGNGGYALYRDAGGNPVFKPNTTSAQFQLRQSLATLYSPATFSNHPVDVKGGSLAVNFVNNTFNTSLNLASPMIGSAQVAAQGVISNTGTFASTSGNASVAGGFNHNASQAGYFFEKSVPQGAISGITLWGR